MTRKKKVGGGGGVNRLQVPVVSISTRIVNSDRRYVLRPLDAQSGYPGHMLKERIKLLHQQLLA